MIGSVPTFLVVFFIFDAVEDVGMGAPFAHVFIEGVSAALSALGAGWLGARAWSWGEARRDAERDARGWEKQAMHWRAEASRHVAGLGAEIDRQFATWSLTDSEREVALLLIKGLSLRDIADVRRTAEKTARAQSAVVYAKAGLAGRSELAAFFLEDLLAPRAQAHPGTS